MASWPTIARRIRVPMGFVFAVVYFWLAKPGPASIVLGACVACFGLLIRGLASGHVTKDEQLTTSGPYAYMRNPLYFGSTLIAAGFAIAGRNWWIVLLLVVMFVVVYVPTIQSEEKFLRATFPEFEEYARQVPRFFPRLRAFGLRRGSFSWNLYTRHREYNAMLGTAVMLAALAAKLLWWPK